MNSIKNLQTTIRLLKEPTVVGIPETPFLKPVLESIFGADLVLAAFMACHEVNKPQYVTSDKINYVFIYADESNFGSYLDVEDGMAQLVESGYHVVALVPMTEADELSIGITLMNSAMGLYSVGPHGNHNLVLRYHRSTVKGVTEPNTVIR